MDIVERLRSRPNDSHMETERLLDEAADHIEALREALTPSADTKAAYIGKFSIAIERQINDDNEVDDETEGAADPYEHVTVPWTTIKEIMAAIKDRANEAR